MEFHDKCARVRELLARENLSGVVVRKVSNFAWLTGGATNFVGTHTDAGASSILVTAAGAFLLANNIEAPRVRDEEVGGLGLEELVVPWWEEGRLPEEARRAAGGELGSDVPLPGCRPVALEPLHFPLLAEELARYRALARETGEMTASVCRWARPGVTELDVAGRAARRFWSAGIQPVTLLVAADERIAKYRHPVATSRKLERILLVVVCARRGGLIASVSRLVSFGPVPGELARRHRAVCEVDAALIAGTRPGRRLSEVFAEGLDAYRKAGFPDEWKLHHQGGPTGYVSRYSKATAESAEVVAAGQAYAWNPSITGTKSEDTILVGEEANDVISRDRCWPKVEGLTVSRPAILVR